MFGSEMNLFGRLCYISFQITFMYIVFGVFYGFYVLLWLQKTRKTSRSLQKAKFAF